MPMGLLLFVVLVQVNLLTPLWVLSLSSYTCKLSHSGIDYTGSDSKSFSGPRCRRWDSKDLPSGRSAFSDKDFPDGSKHAAGNKCRNPTGRDHGPWCYTVDSSILIDVCDVPLCSEKHCRVSGVGVEYAGNITESASSRKCLEWAGISMYKKHNPNLSKFASVHFPEARIKWAGNKCRNPDGDLTGPWCYVKASSYEVDKRVTRAYCDVPFCDPLQGTVVSTKHVDTHSEYIELNSSLSQLKFAVRLWDPRDWSNVTGRISLSLLAVPSSGKDQIRRRTGFEVVLSNRESYFTTFEDDKESLPGLLVGSNWTRLRLSWGDEYISLLREGQREALLVQDFPTNRSKLAGLDRVTLKYLAVSGRNVIWSFPDTETGCPIHIASRPIFSTSTMDRMWNMKSGPTGHEVQLFIRSNESVCVVLRVSPSSQYPELRVCMGKTSSFVSYRKNAGAADVRLKQVFGAEMLSWWSWREMSLTLSTRSETGSSMSVWTRGSTGPGVPFMEVELPDDVRSARWFGVGPLQGTTLFTLFCLPKDPEPPLPPECLDAQASAKAAHYQGTQWVTGSGLPCLPWSDSALLAWLKPDLLSDELYTERSKEKARNYCRNPGGKDPSGPFCFALRNDGQVVRFAPRVFAEVCRAHLHNAVLEKSINSVYYLLETKQRTKRESCSIRHCRSANCRLAGTANDYMGKLNVTRTGRNCRPWVEAVPEQLKNDSLYPELSLREARNFCRNPSRSVAGAWCFTTDPKVTADLCDVPDCVAGEGEDCIVLDLGGKRGDEGVFILPDWRLRGLRLSLKEWNPEMSDGIMFEFRSLDEIAFHRLTIGAEKNEKITFEYVDNAGKALLLSSKSVPHVVPAGQWAAMWIKFPDGKVQVGNQGIDTPMHEWSYKSGKDHMPHIMSYSSILGHSVGISFNCQDCHIEKTSSATFNKLFPWNFRKPKEKDTLKLYLQGNGEASIALITLPGQRNIVLNLGVNSSKITVTHNDEKSDHNLSEIDILKPMIIRGKWTLFEIFINETQVAVNRKGVRILTWRPSSPVVVYFFSVGARKGELNWAVNCLPVELTAGSIHGGWSSWTTWKCSASCGGGRGWRERTCTNPTPNILGRACSGPSILHGSCNDWPCGQVNPNTEVLLQTRLQTTAHEIRAEPGQRLSVLCDPVGLQAVRREVPEARIIWTKDGALLDPSETDRIKVWSEGVRILSVRGSDTGVWACLWSRVSGEVDQDIARVSWWRVLRVVSLVVRRAQAVRLSEQVALRCNALPLALLYEKLYVSWTLNGRTFNAVKVHRGKYTARRPSETNNSSWPDADLMLLDKIRSGHQGQWRCFVNQFDLNLTWMTAWITLKTLPEESLLSHILEDTATAWLFSWTGSEDGVLVMLIAIVGVAVAVCTAAYFVAAIAMGKRRSNA